MKIIFDHCEPQTASISTFYFLPVQPLQYLPGQYTEFTLDHVNPDNRGISRLFTLSSSPTEKLISITTKIVIPDGSTFTNALRRLKPGDTLFMGDPKGKFLLPDDRDISLLFVAGGIGITPFHSMVAWLDAVGQKRHITLLYAVHSEEDIICKNMLNSLGENATIIVEKPSNTWTGLSGRITQELIFKTGKPQQNTITFISGPEAMVQALEQAMGDKGIDRQKIMTDIYIGYPAI